MRCIFETWDGEQFDYFLDETKSPFELVREIIINEPDMASKFISEYYLIFIKSDIRTLFNYLHFYWTSFEGDYLLCDVRLPLNKQYFFEKEISLYKQYNEIPILDFCAIV